MKISVRRPPALAAVQHHASGAAALLKALANDQRLQVLCLLLDGPLTVGQINARVRLSQPALSQHLAVLRGAGLVTSRRRSQAAIYRLVEGPALGIIEVLYRNYCVDGTTARPRALEDSSAGQRDATRWRR